MGSGVVVNELSCSVVCGLFTDQGSNLCPLHWQGHSYTVHHQGSPGMFNFFEEKIYCFPQWTYHFIFPWAMHKGSNFSISLPILFFSFICLFLIKTILMGLKWYLIVVMIFIFLMISNVEHLFMCLLAIYLFSSEKFLFKSFAHFWFGLLAFCCWILGVLYIVWILTPLSDIWLVIILYHPADCLSILLILSSDTQFF